MGTKPINFVSPPMDPIDIVLGSTAGQAIDIKDIKVNYDSGGLFEYEGRQVLLFIPNHDPHYKLIDDVIKEPNKGNKFHVSDCSTLQQMKKNNRFNKYAVTNNLSGKFKIYNNKSNKIDAKLYVCQNCLKKLNYKNCTSPHVNINEVVRNFDIEEFFETYSALFEELPDSNNIKESNNFNIFICETCKVNLKNNIDILIKSNDSVFCKDCYRKQDNHVRTFITNKQKNNLYRERTKQNKSQVNTWNDVYKYLDIALHPYIHRIRGKFAIPTHIGYIPQEDEKLVLDLVWLTDNNKKALVVNRINPTNTLGNWYISTLAEAIEKLNKRNK
jgi:ribosome-binding protein aMBF1 (putative translation factor)